MHYFPSIMRKKCVTLLLITGFLTSLLILSFYANKKSINEERILNLAAEDQEASEAFVQENSTFTLEITGSTPVKLEINNATKVILYYTSIQRQRVPTDYLENCPGMKGKCMATSDLTYSTRADALIFHSWSMNDRKFEKLKRNVSTFRRPEQYFIYYDREATPARNKHIANGFENFFNLTMTYLKSSDIFYGYGYEGFITKSEALQKGIPFKPLASPPENFTHTKHIPVFGAVSNCKTPSHRRAFLKAVDRHLHVFITGLCSFRVEEKATCPRRARAAGEPCLVRHIKDSYFFVALENSVCVDYLTEKYWYRYHLNSIPILWSRRVVKNYNFPPKSAIFVDDYKSVDDFVNHLKYLMANTTAYREYFDWRKEYMAVESPSSSCKVCMALHDAKLPGKTYSNVIQWMRDESKCDAVSTGHGQIKGNIYDNFVFSNRIH